MKLFANAAKFGGRTKIVTFYARSQIYDKRLLASSLISPPVRVEQLGPHWTDFHTV
jgi:hypothetical protein